MKIINKIRGYRYDAVIIDDLDCYVFNSESHNCVVITEEYDSNRLECFATWPLASVRETKCKECEVQRACDEHYIYRTEPPNPQSPDPIEAIVILEENDEKMCDFWSIPSGCVVILEES